MAFRIISNDPSVFEGPVNKASQLMDSDGTIYVSREFTRCPLCEGNMYWKMASFNTVGIDFSKPERIDIPRSNFILDPFACVICQENLQSIKETLQNETSIRCSS